MKDTRMIISFLYATLPLVKNFHMLQYFIFTIKWPEMGSALLFLRPGSLENMYVCNICVSLCSRHSKTISR